MPIIHTIIRYHPSYFADGGTWIRKASVMRSMVDGNPVAEIYEEVLPLPHELVIRKQYASAFFGNTVVAMLTAQGIDTAVLIGCSTSRANQRLFSNG